MDTDAEIEAELVAGDRPSLYETDDSLLEALGWLELVEFVTADCPSEADQGLEPPDAEIAGCPLDVEGKFDPTGRPDDAEIADAPLRADLGFTPPVCVG